MKIDRAGIPFVAAAAVPAVAFVAFRCFAWAALFALLAAGMLFFFRDPERRPAAASPSLVVSPADGKVMVAGAPQPDAAPAPGDWQQVSIFLSPMDVHVNRMPVTGRVTKVDYRPGRCRAAYLPGGHRSRTNAARSGSTEAAGPSSAARSRACWCAGSCVAPGLATRSARATATA